MVDTKTSTPASSTSLRALLPRIFSKAQPVGAVDTLVKTVRAAPPEDRPRRDRACVHRRGACARRATPDER